MIQRLIELEAPIFPEVGRCDKWMLHIWANYSLAKMIDDEVSGIEHISHLSSEGYGCTKFAIHVDKEICISAESYYRDKLSFGEPIERNISYLVDCDRNDIIYISDNPEELKSVALALRIAESYQPIPIDKMDE